MRMGIKNKIFAFTVSLFVVVLLIMLAVQTFVIGEFFERRQLQEVEMSIEEMVWQTLEDPEPERQLYRNASEYSMMHNTPLVIIDPEKSFFEQLNQPGNSILVQTEDGQILNLIVEGFEPDALSLIEDGSFIEFSGFQVDEQTLRAFFIHTDKVDMSLETVFREMGMPDEEIDRILSEFADRPVVDQHGEIIFNNARNMESQGSNKLIGYHGEHIERFLFEYGIENFFENEAVSVFDFEDQWTSTHNRLVVRPVFFPDEKQLLIIAVVSTANTESTVSIFQEFYWINFVVALIISFIATYVFAGRFSKPIQHMETVAKDMANMDFDRKIQITSNDEIGSLANSLNLLSNALQEKIVDLEDANLKLTDEIEFKTHQEEIRKQFVANVSHELKTPITIMKGLVEGVKEGIYNDPIHLHSVLDEVQRMEQMVFEMLEISRYEARGIELKLDIFSLDESVNRVVRRFKGLIQDKGLQTKVQLEEGFINADQDKIEQVIENLVSNAVRYCHDKGFLNLSIKTDNTTIRFIVENDGDPIPADAIENIWKPFYRVDESRNRKKGGTGLGLVIVKSILEEHHAEYGVENTEVGVRFYFELPRVVESLDM